jgi:hypothetical protein
VPVARLGHYEVRLVEAAPDGEELSLELHDVNRRVVLDSVHCDDLEVAEVFAEEMILWARELQSNKQRRSFACGADITSEPASPARATSRHR